MIDEKNIGGKILRLLQGDITRQKVDAIVNAANSSLLGGGGVDGAIHRAAGPQLLEECQAVRDRQRGCPTGQAVITMAGKLQSRYVIHTVGPIWSGGSRDEDALLASCYQNSLALAGSHDCRSVAFPSISTGAYGFPVVRAAEIALRTVVEAMPDVEIQEIRFILFSESDLNVYAQALGKIP